MRCVITNKMERSSSKPVIALMLLVVCIVSCFEQRRSGDGPHGRRWELLTYCCCRCARHLQRLSGTETVRWKCCDRLIRALRLSPFRAREAEEKLAAAGASNGCLPVDGRVVAANEKAARAVHKFNVNGYSATKAMAKHEHVSSKRLTVAGYAWEIHYTPGHDAHWHYWVAFKLVFLGVGEQAQRAGGDDDDNDAGAVKASLSCCLSHAFGSANESSPWVLLVKRRELEASGFITGDSFAVRCTITVLSKNTINSAEPSPDLHLQLGELLRSGRFADVEFIVCGVSIAAHRCVLAARSPSLAAAVLKGGTRKKDGSVRVEVKDDMRAGVFRALLHFIYTDTLMELDWREDGSDPLLPRTMVMSLNEAAGRYGLERLKQICENMLGFDDACSADCAVM
uniref:BTB domain-containing protein n=1 Tax=Oryza glumipatula TaxID=40148 RepID=A0A0E0AD09_9ORYZ